MPANEYRFVTNWMVRATVQEISDILENPCRFVEWWPEVYLSVRELEPRVVELLTRGWLPYRLHWFSRRTESRHPYGYSLLAWGDLEGTGVWTFTPQAEYTSVRYEWTVQAKKPALRYLSPLLRPLFAANHRWAMNRGEKGLKAEIRHRQANAGSADSRISGG